MSEFQMDKSGYVLAHDETAIPFDALDKFTQGYIEAMFFTEETPGTIRAGGDDSGEFRDCNVWNADTDSALPGDCTFGDLAPEALAAIVAECATFRGANAGLLAAAYERNYDAMQAGRDFWFTRNGHGVGFWDRSELFDGGLGDALSDAARAAHSVNVYLGDDGKIHHA